MKLKPKKNFNLFEKTKNEIKFNYINEKAKRDVMEEDLEKIKKKGITILWYPKF